MINSWRKYAMEKGRLLCLLAHPDDETFGPGGTISKYSDKGVETFLATATRGEAGMLGDPPVATRENVGDVRAEELRVAAKVLGIKEIYFMGFIDGTLSEIEDDSLLERAVYTIRKFRPHVIITFGPGGISGHPDHKTISRVTTDAYEISSDPDAYAHQFDNQVKSPWEPLKLYYFEIPDEWLKRARANLNGVPLSQITTIIDTAEYVERKIEAFYCHKTQKKDYTRILSRDNYRQFIRKEYYVLARSRVEELKYPERDLFLGIDLTGPHS
jgi:LmbE family N-acetylglucosaminyl deacetylase